MANFRLDAPKLQRQASVMGTDGSQLNSENTMRKLTLVVAVTAWLGLLVGQAVADEVTEKCSPEQAAQRYPSLVGKTIKIGADPQTPPFAMRDSADFNKIIGVDIDLANAVLDCVGVKHEVYLAGWSGLMPATAGGQVDVFWDTLLYTAVRAKQLDFVIYMQAGTGAMTQAGNPKKITSMETSCGTSYAVGVGTVEEAMVVRQDQACRAEGKPGIALQAFPDFAAGVRLVQSGRIDVVMTNLAIIDSLAGNNPNLYVRAYAATSGLSLGAALKKGNIDLLHAIRDGLQILQANGTQKAILAKYKVDPDLQIPALIKTE